MSTVVPPRAAAVAGRVRDLQVRGTARARLLTAEQWLILGVLLGAVAVVSLSVSVDVAILGRGPRLPYAALAVLVVWLVRCGRNTPVALRAGVAAAAALVGIGLAFAARLAARPPEDALPFLALAGAAFLVASFPRAVEVLERLPRRIPGGIAVLLVAAPLVVGAPLNGAHIRVDVPGIGFVQPSDLARVLLVVGLAGSLSAARPLLVAPVGGDVATAASYARLVATCSTPALLGVGFALISNDMGPALLVAGVTAAMLALAGARPAFWVVSLAIAAAALGALLTISPKLAGRVADWRDPIPSGSSTPLTQVGSGLLAMADGGFDGQGVGRGFPLLVPAHDTDMVLAVIGEELGLLVLAALLALAGLVFVGGMRVARAQVDPARYLMAAGLSMLLLGQTVLVAGGVLGALPLTGMPVPFLSVSGSNLAANALALGLLCALARSSAADRRGGATLAPVLAQRHRVAVVVGALLVGAGLARVVAIGIDAPELRGAVGSRDPRPTRLTMLDRGTLTTLDGHVLGRTVPRDGAPVLRPGTAVRDLTGSKGYEAVVGAQLRSGSGWGLEHALADRLRCDGAPVDGRGCPTVVTSLRADAQEVALDALGDRAGAVVAVDVRTGEVVVYVSNPGPSTDGLGDPTTPLTGEEVEPDLVTGSTTMPGSVGKIASSIAAVEADVPLLQEATSSVTVDGSVISSFDAGCGGLGLADAIARSCNPELAHVGAELGAVRLGELTDGLLNQQADLSGLPIASSSLIGPGVTAYDAASGAIGVGNAQATPLSIVQLTALVARGGSPVGLTLEHDRSAPVPDLSVDTDAAAIVAQGMRDAVVYGTASSVEGLEAVQAAMKTGTADFAADASHAWITGFAPFDAPQYAITVLVPSSAQTPAPNGSTTAGPIASAVLRQLIAPAG